MDLGVCVCVCAQVNMYKDSADTAPCTPCLPSLWCKLIRPVVCLA